MVTEPTTFASVCIERVFAAIEAATGESFSIHALVRLAGRLDETRLARAVRLILEMEPALRCSFEMGLFQPYWKLHNDLDESQFFEVVETNNEEEALQAVVARDPGPSRNCGIKAYLIRGLKDTLCVKLNHKVGDGQTVKQFLYRMAETYSRLGVDPGYTPPARIFRDRSVMQVTRNMSAADQRRVLRQARSRRRVQEEVAEWRLPRAGVADSKPSSRRFVVKQVSPERYAAIVDYAKKHRETVNTVLLAAFARAAVRVNPRSSGTRSEIMQTVDLRRHLADKNSLSHCNLSSILALSVEQGSADPLETYVAALGAQIEASRREFMGLDHPLIRWELNRKRRFLFNCIPFRVIKRTTRRRIRGLERAGSPARMLFSNVGGVDPKLVVFGGVGADDAYLVSGTLMPRELLILVATEYAGCLSLVFSYSPYFLDGTALTAFLDQMISNLPS